MPRRRKDKVDSNQGEIVDELRAKGYSVELGHDDILVGYKGRTYWFEIKQNSKSNIKPSQLKLLSEFRGHYKIVWSAAMIINEIETS